MLASFAVGAGIIFERPAYPPSVHRIAFWLVIGGIAIEALCTIFLFVFDEGISSAQQSKIVKLEQNLIDLYEADKQRQLKPAQVASIVAALRDKIPHINIIRTNDPEASQFAVDIFINLSKGGLPIGIEDHDEDTKYFGFFPAPLFLVTSDQALGKLMSKTFLDAGINFAWDIKPSTFVPWQPPNSLYVSLKAPLMGASAWDNDAPPK